MKGFIKWYSETHGYGFITDDNSKTDIFFHFSNTLDKVVASDAVTYEIGEGREGPKAIEVKRIKKQEDGNG